MSAQFSAIILGRVYENATIFCSFHSHNFTQKPHFAQTRLRSTMFASWDRVAPLRANFPDAIEHRQVQNVIGVLKLWIPDATAHISPATQFDAERIAVVEAELARCASILEQISREENTAWDKTLDQYEQGRLPKREIHTVLSKTPKVLQKCGLEDLPVVISTYTLNKITGRLNKENRNRHKVPLQELRKMQAEIGSPIAVFKSRKRKNSIVVLTEMIDADNNYYAIVAIHPNVGEGPAEAHHVTSTYGKEPSGIDLFVSEGRTLYIDTKKSRRFEASGQLQLLADSPNRGRVLTEEDATNDVLSANNVNGNFEKLFQRAGVEVSEIVSRGIQFQQIRWIKQGSEVFGWFDPTTCKIVVREGCTATAVMEAVWHVTFHFVKATVPELHTKMRKFARNASQGIKDVVNESYPELKTNSEAWIEKVGAVFFSREHVRKIRKVVKANRKSLFSKVLHAFGNDEVNLGKIAKLPSRKAVAALANAFVRGKRLG